MSLDPIRVENILRSLVAASREDYDVRVPLEEIDDEFLEIELGVNYLIEELVLRRDQNAAQRDALLAQSQQIAAQTADLVLALSTPILSIWPGVLALPIIGRVDAERTMTINEVLLARVVAERARYVILDLTGVSDIEAATLTALLRMIGAIGLLGVKCFVTGIGPRGALQIVELGSDQREFRALARVSDALATIFSEMSRR